MEEGVSDFRGTWIAPAVADAESPCPAAVASGRWFSGGWVGNLLAFIMQFILNQHRRRRTVGGGRSDSGVGNRTIRSGLLERRLWGPGWPGGDQAGGFDGTSH